MKVSTDRRDVIPFDHNRLEHVRSHGGGQRLRVKVTNSTAREVKLCWRDFQGDEPASVQFAVAAGGQSVTDVNSFANHAWVVRGPGGESLAAFLPTAPGVINISLLDGAEPAPSSDKLAIRTSNTEENQAFGFRATDSPSVKSQSGEHRFTLVVTNLSTRPIEATWKDYSGSEPPAHSREVLPGGTHTETTYLTHPWVLRDDSGDVLGVVTPEQGGGGTVTVSGYRTTEIQGFQVHTNLMLLPYQDTKQAVDLLTTKLGLVERLLQPGRVQDLKGTPIWLEDKIGNEPMVYHPSPDWLWQHGITRDKAKSVEIPNIMNFVNWTDQPMVILHELAHAYHDQFLQGGMGNPKIEQAYDDAMAAERYPTQYANRNAREYFAELTEAFFGVNDFFPKDKEELAKHDPAGYALLEEIWVEGKYRADSSA